MALKLSIELGDELGGGGGGWEGRAGGRCGAGHQWPATIPLLATSAYQASLQLSESDKAAILLSLGALGRHQLIKGA